MTGTDDRLRSQLVRILDWAEAHADFDKAVGELAAEKRGVRPAGFEHSAWQLLEHMRLAQADIIDFCVNTNYVHTMTFPDDYWPVDPAPASVAAWDDSISAFKRDRERMKTVARETDDLHAKVPAGKDRHTYLRAILLLADHNAYHLGQLVALRKALGAW